MREAFYLSVVEDVMQPPYLMANVFVREESYFLDFHCHPFYHVNFVTEGTAVIHTPQGDAVVSAPGYMVIPPGLSHAISSEKGYSQVGMNLAREGDERTALLSAFGNRALKTGDASHIGADFSLALSLLSSGIDATTAWRIRRMYDDLLFALLAKEQRPSALVARLTALGRETDLCALSLTELCHAMHFSKTHLERLFRKEMGSSAGAYLSRLRINRASTLLTESDLPLSAIAEKCGFFDASHLGKCFRRATGLSPGEYRKRGGAL